MASWGSLAGPLGALVRRLGSLWGRLGAVLGVLDRSWIVPGALGPSWRSPGTLLVGTVVAARAPRASPGGSRGRGKPIGPEDLARKAPSIVEETRREEPDMSEHLRASNYCCSQGASFGFSSGPLSRPLGRPPERRGASEAVLEAGGIASVLAGQTPCDMQSTTSGKDSRMPLLAGPPRTI